MKILMASNFRIILLASICLIIFCPCGCIRINVSGIDRLSISTKKLPHNHPLNCGIASISDTLLCYAIEYDDSLDKRYSAFFYQSLDDGDNWELSGRLDLPTLPAFPYFVYSDGNVLFAFDDLDSNGMFYQVYLSSDSCMTWDLVKHGAGTIRGASLYKKNNVFVLQSDSLEYAVLFSEDKGNSWNTFRKKVPIQHKHQVILNQNKVVFYDYKTIIQETIGEDVVDTLFVSTGKYGVADLIADRSLVGFTDNMRRAAVLKNGEQLYFNLPGWHSGYSIPVFLSDCDEFTFISIRNLSISKQICASYVIWNEGKEVMRLCNGPLAFANGNKAYRILRDDKGSGCLLQCISINI